MDETKYLTNIPKIVEEYGFCKTLLVRHEVIHIKHIFTEIFVRKSINIEGYLDKLELSLFDYMEIMTNRLRKIHHFTRTYQNDCDRIVKQRRDSFFGNFELYQGLNKVIILDFDGVTTCNKFKPLYEFCYSRSRVEICSANPTITKSWFKNRDMSLPNNINSMRGKVKKIKRLVEISKKFDYSFFIDNEIEYLEFAWIFGLQTFHWDGNKIKYFTLKTK